MSKYKEKWYIANKKQIRYKQEQYRIANYTKLRAADKIWRNNNKEKTAKRVAKWAKDNPLKRLESQQRRRARKLGSQVIKINVQMLQDRLLVFDGKCAYCSGVFEHWDHVKPLELKGPHILSNLRPSCAKCNTSKGMMHPFLWLKVLKTRERKDQ